MMYILAVISFYSFLNAALAESQCNDDSSQLSQNSMQLIEIAEHAVGIGGDGRVRQIKEDEYSFVGRLSSVEKNEISICTASLINHENNIILTAGHCVESLGKDPLFSLQRRSDQASNRSRAKLLKKGDDWAYYQLENPIQYNGPYPEIKVMTEDEMKDKTLTSIGYPKPKEDSTVNENGVVVYAFVADENCKIFGKKYLSQKLLSNCYTRPSMSGSPLLYQENGQFYIVGIRSGMQWGGIREIFNQVGTTETPAKAFKIIPKPQQ